MAISNFWLGSTIGGWYYSIVPVAVSMRLFMAVTGVVIVLTALISTFIGILTDPIQAKLGIHNRRLNGLLSSIENDLRGTTNSDYQLRDRYLARVFDLVDLLSFAARV